jgi:hypothetical protein
MRQRYSTTVAVLVGLLIVALSVVFALLQSGW